MDLGLPYLMISKVDASWLIVRRFIFTSFDSELEWAINLNLGYVALFSRVPLSSLILIKLIFYLTSVMVLGKFIALSIRDFLGVSNF